jgi:lipopolysaccharide biosynthesis glycosyltransferase
MITVCIGYDPAETVAYHVLCHSILRQSSVPVRFVPINKRNIPEFVRAKEDGSTEFSFSRFLTPYLCGYTGQAIFMDCDMLVRGDLSEILDECDLYHDVFVVKHDYTPKEGKKFLGNTQRIYPKKNWSSVMVFNCFTSACKRLTADAVSNKSGKYLHQFEWADDHRVGELDPKWNHLVGEYKPNPNAKIAHFTLGTPCFNEYHNQEFSDEWFIEKERMNYAYNG